MPAMSAGRNSTLWYVSQYKHTGLVRLRIGGLPWLRRYLCVFSMSHAPLLSALVCECECKVRVKRGNYRGNATLTGYRDAQMVEIDMEASKDRITCV